MFRISRQPPKVGRTASNAEPPPPAIAECLESFEGEAFAYAGLVVRGRNSRVYAARRGAETIAIKECFDAIARQPDSAAAAREFSALESIARATSANPPLAPLPLLLCRDRGVYAMTWIPGRRATDVICDYSTTLNRASELGAAAGDWLRRFHGLGPKVTRENDFQTNVEVVKESIQSNRDADRLVRCAATSLVDRAAEAAAVPMPSSWLHGDMKSDNLIISGQQATAVDLKLSHENSVLYDLAPFLNHLDLLIWTPRGIFQKRKLQVVAETFLQTYSAKAASWKLPLAWLRVYLLIQIAGDSSGSTQLRLRYAQWAARRALIRAIDELEKA